MNIELTDHAKVRIQQRGIPASIIELLLTFGRTIHDHHGSEVVFFDQQARHRLRKSCSPSVFNNIETKLDSYAVIGSDGAVITVGHRTKRIIRH